MATDKQSTPFAPGAASGSSQTSKKTSWADLAPKSVDYEDTMGAEKVKVVWAKMMDYAGIRGADENTQSAFRLAVYVYACKNGTSREGNYAGQIVLNNGTAFSASVIPLATTKMNIRKFFRGNAVESYNSLKESKVMENDERFVAKVSALGISPECAFATADWLTDCSLLTPAETSAHEKSFRSSIERARRVRGGVTLEEVEDGRRHDGLVVQGKMDGAVKPVVDF